MSGFTKFLFGGEESGTPVETRGGTELLAGVFEDVLRTGDFGRLGSQGFGFAAFPGGGASALPGPSPGRFGAGLGEGGGLGPGGGLVEPRGRLVKGKGFTRGGSGGDPNARKAKRKGGGDGREDDTRTSRGAIPGAALDPALILAAAQLLPRFQFGGRLRPGQLGLVGDAGPEVARARPDGGVDITPLSPTGRPGRTSPGAQNIATQQTVRSPIDPRIFLPPGPTRGGGGGPSPLDLPTLVEPLPPDPGVIGPQLTAPPGGAGGGEGTPMGGTPVEDAVLRILGGGGPLVPEEGQDALSMFLGGGGAAGLPPEAQEALSGLLGAGAISPGAQDIISGIRGRPLIPGEAGGLLSTIQGEAISPQAQEIISRIQSGQLVPEEAQGLLSSIQGGELVPEEARGLLAGLQEGGGVPDLPPETQAALSRLLGMTGAGVPAGAEDLVSALTGDPAALNEALFASLEPFEQRQTEQQVAQLREGFGAAGGRFGTGLVGAETELRGELSAQFERARQQALLETLGIQAGFLPTLFESARQREATQAGLVGEQIRAGTAGAQTQAGVLSSLLGRAGQREGAEVDALSALLGRAGQREGVGADVLSSILGAETARAGTSADALASILGAEGVRGRTEADVLASVLGAETAGRGTQADIIGQLLGTQTAQRGQTGDLLRSLIGAETDRFGTVADFIPRQMGALTQAQLASLAPIELISRFFSPGSPAFQQGAFGDLAKAAAGFFA